MAFTRTPGVRTDLRALASQVHPVFMLPPLAASGFGAVLAERLDPLVAGVHLVAVFCALYTAHVKDGYVDFHLRGEDDDHPMTAAGCRRTLALSTAGFATATLGLFVLVGPVAALLALPGWIVGYFHAPQLDTNPVTATTGYPLGIAFALLGGFYVQAETLTATPLAFALVFVLILAGIKVIDDAKDVEYDRTIDKRTVAVVVGHDRSRQVAFALMGVGLVLVTGIALTTPVFPRSAVLAVVGFGAVALLTRRADDRLATMLLIRGSYVFLALLVVGVWWRPLG